jgi:uncharacterized protein YecE (DUF72 family)
MDESIYSLLRRYKAGFCIFDMPGLTSPLEITTEYAYFRSHGKGELYSGSYPDSELSTWADRIRRITPEVNHIYTYFNNDAGSYAIQNATSLRRFLEGR